MTRKLTIPFGAHPLFENVSVEFGSALNLNIHLHLLCLDGVYVCRPDRGLRFTRVKGEKSTASRGPPSTGPPVIA